MTNKLLAAALMACALSAAHAAQAAPTVTITSQLGGQDNAAYTGTLAIGGGGINDANTLFFVQEQQAAGAQGWVFFADPASLSRFGATLSFNTPILAVYSSRADLGTSTPTYGIDVDHDGLLDDYANNASMGLEGSDTLAYTLGGNTLTLDWQVQAAGDMMRVLTALPVVSAVPEPSSLALLGLGLVAMGVTLRKRRG